MKKMVFVLMIFTFIPLKAFSESAPKAKLTQAECVLLLTQYRDAKEGNLHMGSGSFSSTKPRWWKKSSSFKTKEEHAQAYNLTKRNDAILPEAIMDVYIENGCQNLNLKTDNLISEKLDEKIKELEASEGSEE